MRPIRLPRRAKYGAQPTVVDGIRFASKAEARRYGELRLLEKAGEVRDLELQPVFPLHAKRGGVVGIYRADFRYSDRAWNIVVEDVKGFKTPLYRWKKKHVEQEYNVTIQEIRS